MYPVPPNEAERLRVLDETGLIFSEPSHNFDRLCRLAAELFDAPMAAVSFLSKDIQWFKASIGLDFAMTPREAAFCNHTILHEDVLVVSDASRDHRFETNPLVTGDPGIRFYAGAPIVFSRSIRLGTLCVLDARPRSFSALQKKCLKSMGESLGTETRLIYAFRMMQRTSLCNAR
ncbi:GAF domain-containing protein [Alsobacter sp. KACC 23698]|uniref:GAF domain-containing protein n=1 Tax=Alsobacter sp. KACC 23698 TaxID=3149229 RepID=A0AAU7JKJ6_9HYPH